MSIRRLRYLSDHPLRRAKKDYEVQDIIENRCVYKTPVTVIVHDIDFVNKMLREGQYFFTDIEKEGIVLYDSSNAQLAERKPLSPKMHSGFKRIKSWKKRLKK